MAELVELYCIKEKGKLRMRIASPGFIPTANIQCDRKIRLEGKRFIVPRSEIKLITRAGSRFYSIKKGIKEITEEDRKKIAKQEEKMKQEAEVKRKDYKGMKTFQDVDENICNICMENEKDIVFDPCLHFYACKKCSNELKDCHMCRAKIIERVSKDLFG